MKHSPIIQANLDKRTSKKDKLAYLLYAYKEWVIGISISLILIVTFAVSMLTNKRADLTVRVISDYTVAPETIQNLSNETQENLAEEIVIDIQNYLIGNMGHQQVLYAQIAAKEIDLFIIPTTASQDVLALYDEMTDEQNIFEFSEPQQEFSVAKVANAPHTDLINDIKKALSAN